MIPTEQQIKNELTKMFHSVERNTRRLRIYTGVGGMDSYRESVEKYAGYIRIRIGNKVPRFLHRVKDIIIRQSLLGYYYRLVKTKQHG